MFVPLVIAGVAIGAFWFWKQNTLSLANHFIMVHSPTCVYCIEAMPEFDKLGSNYLRRRDGQIIKNLKIDGRANPKLATLLKTEGFPHFVYVDESGKQHVFNKSARKTAEFIEFLDSFARP